MRRSLGPILLIALGLGLILGYLLLSDGLEDAVTDVSPTSQATEPTIARLVTSDSAPAAMASQTPQPIYPTPTGLQVGGDSEVGHASTSRPSSTATPDSRQCPLADCLSRSGVSGRLEDISAAAQAGLPVGNFLDWWLNSEPPMLGGQRSGSDSARYWQMVSVRQSGPAVSWSKIDEVLAARPGAIWIIGNEPDVAWQDNTPAAAYAAIYHDVYRFIKGKDPAAQIAIAGVAQPSPLRFAYLEQVLDTYRELYDRPMPVDIWTVHAFILREQLDSWGVGIPPGMEEEEGLLYEIADHDDLEIFKESLVAFRAWMVEHGYGDKPLAVTEFGILHPSDYGFPPESVIRFLIGASDFMATARNETGYPGDDSRLVQFWFWYSAYDDGDFPTGNLYDPQTKRLTAVGQAYRHYLEPQ